MWQELGALVPSIGVLALFVLVVRSMIRADRRARAEHEREDAEVAARLEQ